MYIQRISNVSNQRTQLTYTAIELCELDPDPSTRIIRPIQRVRSGDPATPIATVSPARRTARRGMLSNPICNVDPEPEPVNNSKIHIDIRVVPRI